MQSPAFDVLYEDNHVLAVSKPARLPTMGVPEGEPSLLKLAKLWIKERYDKPGNVYLGIVSRLDAPVTGVVVLARTSKAANRLTQQFRSREVDKTYWAITEGSVTPDRGEPRPLAQGTRKASSNADRGPNDRRGERSEALLSTSQAPGREFSA